MYIIPELLLLLAALAAPVTYSATVLRVVDGDTVNVRIYIWFDQTIETSIRMRGVDTPELKGRCDTEKALALKAKQFTESHLPPGMTITLASVKPGKFGGRYDADVILWDGKRLADLLIAEGLARPYKGEK